MNAILFATRLLPAVVAFTAAGCWTPGNRVVKSIDRSQQLENAELWRQVKREPAMFVPKAMPAGASTGPSRGKWINDPQDATAYFVPNEACGGLTPAVWEGEALKV